MPRNIFAYTPPGNCPPYVSLNRQDDGQIVLSVRGPGGDPNDPTAYLPLPSEELAGLARGILRELGGADVWKAIGEDPELARARQRLSMHELRTICRHAWANPADPVGDKETLERSMRPA